jgi:hypothetical protein
MTEEQFQLLVDARWALECRWDGSDLHPRDVEKLIGQIDAALAAHRGGPVDGDGDLVDPPGRFAKYLPGLWLIWFAAGVAIGYMAGYQDGVWSR